ncbi:MAG: carboxypeptidase-like regulatory domain-containing protein [bacterium]|nr:carboxypeptidase-like regulatory domain-containing protein [bacterium]
MKKFFITILLIFFITSSSVFASTIEGAVSEEGSGYSSRIIDKNTGLGVSGAKVSLPKQNYTTTTDSDGFFELDTQVDGTTILSVQKENYKPYSVTLQSKALSTPIVIGIERTGASGLVLDSNMYHLGDNNYSDLSANAGEFRMATIGPFYTKRFILKNLKFNKPIFLVIGSIIGIDTDMARSIGQNKITNAFASPPEIYFNGNKISEIQINGDGQKIKIPPPLIRRNQINEITIRTGHNLMQTAYIDYDDIEFMNLFIEN